MGPLICKLSSSNSVGGEYVLLVVLLPGGKGHEAPDLELQLMIGLWLGSGLVRRFLAAAILAAPLILNYIL
jgi:hypothetical protein